MYVLHVWDYVARRSRGWPKITGSGGHHPRDISLTFDRKIVVPEGAKSQFIVTVDGEEVAVNKVETTNTVGKIKLELDTKLNEVAWKTLTVEYIQSDNPNLRLKDSTDNYVANFSIKVPYSALSEALP